MKLKQNKKIKKTKKTKKRGGGMTVRTKRNLNKCSPHNKDNNFSCFTKKSLLKILSEWNKYYNDNIKYSDTFVLGVQWHHEYKPSVNEISLKLFSAFDFAIKKYFDSKQ